MMKSHSEKMKTQSISKHTFEEGKSLYVRLSLPLLEYLSSEYSVAKEGRFSKIKAFKFLVLQSCHTPEDPDVHQAMVNMSKLTKQWGWYRTTVTKFINDLNNMGVVCIKKIRAEKFVSVKPSVLQWVDCSRNEVQRLRDASLQPQTASSQSSSSERRKDLPFGEKSWDK